MTIGSTPTTTLLLALSALLSGGAARAADSTVGLKNPSARILVDQTRAVPTSGTFGLGMSVFRVETDSDRSLASLDARLRTALRAGFTQEGLAYAEDAPDYLVSYALAAGAELDESELNREYGELLRMPAAETREAATLFYQRGALIVDLVDRKAKRLLWRGAILAEIDMNWPEARKQERCDAAVGYLLALYPHPPDAR
jgi:hypothetical protein